MPKPLRGAYKIPDLTQDRIYIAELNHCTFIEYQEYIDGAWRQSDGAVKLPPGMDVYFSEDVEYPDGRAGGVAQQADKLDTVIKHVKREVL